MQAIASVGAHSILFDSRMTKLKLIRRLCLTMFAATLVLVGGITPASAVYQSLCSGYTSCNTQGMSHFGYATAAKNMYWRMATGHNCTNYVAYRLVQNGLPNTKPWSTTGNAYNWGIANAKLTDQTPTVGSVAWWAANRPPIGRSGHVSYVEQVVSADEIIVSEDNWGGNFHWRRVTRDKYWPSGFIHFADKPSTAVPVTGHSPVGAIDRAWVPTPGRVSITGWAFDPDAKSAAVSLTATVGGKLGAAGAERHDLGAANLINAEVAAAYPGVGDHHGAYATVTSAKRGTQRVYLYASNVSGTSGGRKLLGSRTVTITDPDPRGKVTWVSSPKSRQLRVVAWAVDPNAKTSAISVRAYLGGPAGKGHRVNLGIASQTSAAAAKEVPGAGKQHGLDKTVATKWTGKRTVYVYAVNRKGTPGKNALIGRRTITIKK